MSIFSIFKREKKVPLMVMDTLSLLMMLESNLLEENEKKLFEIQKANEDINKQSLDDRNSKILSCKYSLESLGLTNSKNYQFLQEETKKITEKNLQLQSENLQDWKVKNLKKFVKIIKKYFGDQAVLIDSKKFADLCEKYNLKKGFLEEYSGVVPDRNLRDLAKFKDVYNRINQPGRYKKVLYPDEIFLKYCLGTSDFVSFQKEISKNLSQVDDFYYKFAKLSKIDAYYSSDRTVYRKRIDKTADRFSDKILRVKFLSKEMWYGSLSNLELRRMIGIMDNHIATTFSELNTPLYIYCPEEDLNKKKVKVSYNEIKLSPILKDPFVFFESPFGVVVITAWGEEAEDKIYKHYIEVNNLL